MENFNNSVDETKQKHLAEVYADKAYFLLIPCFIAFIVSFISYFLAFYVGSYFSDFYAHDFGVYFEVFSFLCTFISFNAIKSHKFPTCKKLLIAAMIPEGFLFIYDLFNLIVNIEVIIPELFIYNSINGFNWLMFIINYLDITVFVVLIFLYLSYSALCVADGTKKKDSYEDNFYNNTTNRKVLK